MTTYTWRQVRKIYGVAARLKGPDRAAYLDEACSDNVLLRREVESLLGFGDRSEAFLGVVSTGGKQRVSRYEVHHKIGAGGMSLVYQAWDTELDRWVALKFLPPWMMADAASRKRLLHEAKVTSALNHPNIVTVYEVGHENNVDFIVMEFVPGKTLAEIIPPEGLPTKRALNYARALTDALASAHKKGLLHRDLKPGNVMINDEGRAKLLDFGLAAPLKGPGKNSMQSRGTAVYMAPEQLRGRQVDVRSEIYSLGLVMYEMFTGKKAVPAGRLTCEKPALAPAAAAALKKRVPPSLAQIVERCLETQPGKRFQSMEELSLALNAGRADLEAARRAAIAIPTDIAKERSPDVALIAVHLAQLDYESLIESRQAALAIKTMLSRRPSAAARKLVATATKAILTSDERHNTGIVGDTARPIRKIALELLRIATEGRLRDFIQPNDFVARDLFDMDFSGLDLRGLSFDNCFLACTSFEGCDLSGANFKGAAIRNVNFKKATLRNADFTGADWWNSIHLTKAQVRSVKAGSLASCPKSRDNLLIFVAARYAIPFTAWDPVYQHAISEAWAEYLKPSGLRTFINQQTPARGVARVEIWPQPSTTRLKPASFRRER